MPTDIVDALKTIATKHGHVDNVDEYIAQLEKTDRLQFETWSWVFILSDKIIHIDLG